MSIFLHEKFGYRRGAGDMFILTDDQLNPMSLLSLPTKANLLRARPDDSLFIHFCRDP